MKSAIVLASILVVALPAELSAQSMRKSSNVNDAGMKHTITPPSDVKWGPAPPFMPPGSQIAVMFGDPAKKGLFIIRGKMPDGYTIPPHWHSTIENVTVLSGTFNVGMGDKLDKSKGQPLATGGFFSAPPRMSHFAWATGETIVEVTGMGPLDFKYVDPKDDPSKAIKTNWQARPASQSWEITVNPADQMIDPAKQTKNFNPLWRSIFSGEIRNYRGYADRVSTYIARVL